METGKYIKDLKDEGTDKFSVASARIIRFVSSTVPRSLFLSSVAPPHPHLNVCAAAHTDVVVNRCANGIKGTIH